MSHTCIIGAVLAIIGSLGTCRAADGKLEESQQHELGIRLNLQIEEMQV